MAIFLLKRIAFTLAVSVGIIFFSFFGLEMAANSTRPIPSYDPRPPARLAARATAAYLRGLARGDLGLLTERTGAARCARRPSPPGWVRSTRAAWASSSRRSRWRP